MRVRRHYYTCVGITTMCACRPQYKGTVRRSLRLEILRPRASFPTAWNAKAEANAKAKIVKGEVFAKKVPKVSRAEVVPSVEDSLRAQEISHLTLRSRQKFPWIHQCRCRPMMIFPVTMLIAIVISIPSSTRQDWVALLEAVATLGMQTRFNSTFLCDQFWQPMPSGDHFQLGC